ncbi:hypothetical protein HMPREF0663_10706 [Hoylesella oralis ATCC 33269]|uniref:Uncharacterized protein n=1 Tax=Hoylesella oralis ATCC 33269 TaxID=873533 RepID=E7RLH2_9BACT|nr:hypothetical protein HMPREF0663_10706 [Hoylesella oralis ATCC 33269]
MEQCLQRDWQRVVEYIIKDVSFLCLFRSMLFTKLNPLWI